MDVLNKRKQNVIQLASAVLNYSLKTIVIILFMLLFVGRMNPAWISNLIGSDKSLVKSAFFFKSYTSEIMSYISSEETEEIENPFGDLSAGDSDSYDDFYANFAAMVEASSFGDDSEEDDSTWDDDFTDNNEAEKITIVKFSEKWDDFKSNYEDIASPLEKARTGSILTFFACMIILIGLYFVYGKNKVKKTGYLIVIAGSILTALSLLIHLNAYIMLDSASTAIDLEVNYPIGITVFLIISLVIFIISVTLFFIDNADKNEISEFSTFPFMLTYRLLALLLFILLFIPGANPARISENINRNVSLFTSGFSYTTYVSNLQRALIRGWLPESVTRIAWASSLIICIGIMACGAGACMSVGNNKFKKYAHITLFAGSGVSFVSLFGILYSYNLISSSPNIDKVLPLEPGTLPIYFILLAIIFVCTLVSFIKTPAPEKDDVCSIEPSMQLFLMLLPCLILVFLFSYLPLWGWRYAFFDYKPGDTLSMDAWVGLKWFKAPFENEATRSDILRVLRNTLAMSGLGILGSWLPMAFAILLAEIKNTTARKIIQTLTTVPNFISWVLVYAIAFCIFGTEGFISSLMVNGGFWDSGKNMLMGSSGIWFKMWLWGVWKSLGWSAIMYIAAISGIDQQLYEAATVDGASRFQRMWHITVPELLPTYLVLLILSISGILSNGMDQYLVFKNPTNKGPIEVLDLYVYQLSFGSTTNSNIPFSTVVSMFKSVVSVSLLFITNKISKIVRGNSIF